MPRALHFSHPNLAEVGEIKARYILLTMLAVLLTIVMVLYMQHYNEVNFAVEQFRYWYTERPIVVARPVLTEKYPDGILIYIKNQWGYDLVIFRQARKDGKNQGLATVSATKAEGLVLFTPTTTAPYHTNINDNTDWSTWQARFASVRPKK
ncbi:MAG: hypothetical protein WCW02_04940 [Candidatus Buchananbacteria bacterium]